MATSSASSWKQKGNAAYTAGDYDAAIAAYSSAIDLSPNDAGFYSNRSAAHLMAGNFDSALLDANICIALCSESYKGYGRKGAAYYALCEYDRAISAYTEGLKICKKNKQLTVGLQAARQAKAKESKASNSARKANIVTHATRRKSLQSTSTVSDFVQKTREELLLKKAQIQSQLDLIDDLAKMEDEAKLDLLFTLIDRDGDGTVDAVELAAALRKRNKDLAFQESIEHAIRMVASHDLNGDAKLDLDEFRYCIYDMIKELNVSFGEFAEFLVFQINSYDDTEDSTLNEKAENVMKEREEFKHILAHTQMEELFILFDKDGSGELTFKEVAIGLYQITRNVEESTKAAMDLLLMMDKNDTRTLNYEQFCRLILAIVAAANSTFEEIADDLILNLSKSEEISPDNLAALTVADVIYETTRDDKMLQKHGDVDVNIIISNLSYGRLRKLFDLWDVNRDNAISLSELTMGLKAFHDATKLDGDAEQEARFLINNFDSNDDNRLDQTEFSEAFVYYAKSFGIELHILIDFMCVTNTIKEQDMNHFQHIFGMSVKNDKSPIQPQKRLSILLDEDTDVDNER